MKGSGPWDPITWIQRSRVSRSAGEESKLMVDENGPERLHMVCRTLTLCLTLQVFNVSAFPASPQGPIYVVQNTDVL